MSKYEELRDMPVVTVEQIVRFREAVFTYIKQLERDLKLAQEHDTQPYPTAWAYEQACAALAASKDRASNYEEALESIVHLHDGHTEHHINVSKHSYDLYWIAVKALQDGRAT